jgi:diguanylate cyclase (GGDEF)-like protein
VEWRDTLYAPIGRLPRAGILIGSMAAVVGVGWLDQESGLLLSLALVYLAPITFVTWRLGRAAGIFVAGFSVIVGFASDAADAPLALGVVPILNACTRLVVFWLIVVALDGLRRAHEGERRMARTDALTGVANTRHFREEAQRHIAGSRRYRYPVTVAYLDLDDFKAINDTFGHSTGDELLREVGHVLSTTVRPTDLVARIGGDEFVVLLPHTDRSDAIGAMARYRSALLEVMGAHGWGVTVSAGIVELSDEIETVDALIGAADAQMYAAKRAGKDRILASTPRSGAWDHTGQEVLREGAAG